MERLKIRRCPFCGGRAYLNRRYNSDQECYFVFVRCDLCGSLGKTYTEDDADGDTWTTDACISAVDVWNMRTGDSDHVKCPYADKEA